MIINIRSQNKHEEAAETEQAEERSDKSDHGTMEEEVVDPKLQALLRQYVYGESSSYDMTDAAVSFQIHILTAHSLILTSNYSQQSTESSKRYGMIMERLRRL